MSEVTDMLRDLQAGDRAIEEVAAEFAARSWPAPAQQSPKTAEELAVLEQTDPEPDPDGSFAEVARAFYNGIITVDQYSALVEAVGRAVKPTKPDTGEDTETDTTEDTETAEATSPQVSDAPEGDAKADTEGDDA